MSTFPLGSMVMMYVVGMQCVLAIAPFTYIAALLNVLYITHMHTRMCTDIQHLHTYVHYVCTYRALIATYKAALTHSHILVTYAQPQARTVCI